MSFPAFFRCLYGFQLDHKHRQNAALSETQAVPNTKSGTNATDFATDWKIGKRLDFCIFRVRS